MTTHAPGRPTGLGTTAALLPALLAAARPSRDSPAAGPGYAEMPWGDGTHSPLYCPLPERLDQALSDEVDARLLAWAQDRGFQEHELAGLAKAAFGHLVTLAHPDVDDPDALLVAAQMNASWWAADDYYADDTALGAEPVRLPERLTLVMAAMDPVAPAGDLTPPLEAAFQDDLVLRMFDSAVAHLRRHATPAQVQRICYATFSMFVSWTAYAAWRETGDDPTAWEYLAARQHDSFYTSMTLIDAIAGYQVPADLFCHPHVRRAAMRAGTASVIVNDLHSVAKDAADEKPVCNLVLLTAADRDCSLDEATEVTVALHNDLVRGFENDHRQLAAVPSPELQRFLRGLRAWMGGGFHWHATNPRYATRP
ncbi:family 2 encapsulin nanocompartment cargo protein terpene cyclase [Actinomadura macrotermitis]|uniref:Terpene synthase n=1 Tax=Actinomadura macrotermitis TaxID=2585200 RepID=A0A7K0BVB9_9ACTN|nr:family 2 encapsulin nanocompartment cargo protein terpene cyclase [Actinomadura macrotermitis]MQY05016.1 2-methylisoborneol synthase [Actinomadura macrotermitis]